MMTWQAAAYDYLTELFSITMTVDQAQQLARDTISDKQQSPLLKAILNKSAEELAILAEQVKGRMQDASAMASIQAGMAYSNTYH